MTTKSFKASMVMAPIKESVLCVIGAGKVFYSREILCAHTYDRHKSTLEDVVI